MLTRIRRWSWRGLHALSGLQERLRRRFTPAGRVLLAGTFAAGLFGVDTRQSLSFQAFSLGAALLENIPYDENGNVLAGSFTDYAPITINNIPHIKFGNRESPSPFTYNGAKGMGEGGGAALHAISAAVQDALFDKGIFVSNSHCSSNAIFDMLQQPNRGEAVRVESRS